jgi:hypothetical protein
MSPTCIFLSVGFCSRFLPAHSWVLGDAKKRLNKTGGNGIFKLKGERTETLGLGVGAICEALSIRRDQIAKRSEAASS